MLMMISNTEYEAMSGAKTFNLKRHDAGHWCVTSWATDNPTARVFWGCKTFLTLADVEAHYVTFRGITAMLGALQAA